MLKLKPRLGKDISTWLLGKKFSMLILPDHKILVGWFHVGFFLFICFVGFWFVSFCCLFCFGDFLFVCLLEGFVCVCGFVFWFFFDGA